VIAPFMQLKQKDIKSIVEEFNVKLNPDHRYASFDYCYNYFRTTSNKELLKDIEKSCLVLGFYLASWGMFRGSSFLLQKNVRHFQKVIKYISTLSKNIWKIDVDRYDSNNIKIIIEIYNQIKSHTIEGTENDVTLTTKIMLGVFGFIPAFDQYFCNTFRIVFYNECGFRRVNMKSLELIKEFYNANKKEIDKLSNKIRTIDFSTGRKTTIRYPKAKIIDMYGFTKGLKRSILEKQKLLSL